jgi:predicted GNAT family acetyltransferase
MSKMAYKPNAMTPLEFSNFHLPALERDEARHNLMAAALLSIVEGQNLDTDMWSLDAPGQCAIMSLGKPLILSDLSRDHCRKLADITSEADYPSVVGPEHTATWMAARATESGVSFGSPIAMIIHELKVPPKFPGAAGFARQVSDADSGILADWITAFFREATPHETLPVRENLEARAAQGRHTFWIVDGEPVAMAVVVRRTRNGIAIGAVYTPPQNRGKGYAGSVTAAVVEQAFTQGKSMACLYTLLCQDRISTDLRVTASSAS